MYAIIRTGGKQYRVCPGQTIKIERLPVEAGETVNFEEVLLVANDQNLNVGAPLLANTRVIGEIIEHGRAKKINIIKFKRRKHHMKHQGHRQNYTKIKVTGIEAENFSSKHEE